MSAESRTFAHMMELARHIEALLLESDCVVVPGLGGFVAHYTPSTRQNTEGVFLPPTRTIGFNPQLRLNDGLLAQSYSSVYGTNFPEATKRMERDIRALVRTLRQEGEADLPGVGLLHCSIHDAYSFTPYDQLLTTPSLYGLDSFEMAEVERVAAVQRSGQASATTAANSAVPADGTGTHTAVQADETDADSTTDGSLGANSITNGDAGAMTATVDPSSHNMPLGPSRGTNSGTEGSTTTGTTPLPTRRRHRAERKATAALRWSYVAQAAVVLVAVALFFLLSTPLQNTQVADIDQAQLYPGGLWTLMRSEMATPQPDAKDSRSSDKTVHGDAQMAHNDAPKAANDEPLATADKPQMQQQPATDAEQASDKPLAQQTATDATQSAGPTTAPSVLADLHYHVIVASVGTAADAEALAETYRQKGYSQARAIIGDGRNRVCILSLPTSAEAYAILPTINEREGIDGAWVLKD